MKRILILILLCFPALIIEAQDIPYGNNPAAGNYFNVGDAKLYYEIYGKGKLIVLLHGGVYGYIDEFAGFINKLSPNYQVICIATRGHGKSELGKIPCSYQQRAEDAYKVIRHITSDSVTVLGFSDGAYSAFKLASLHPELVKKLVTIGAGDYSKEGRTRKFNYNPEDLMKQAGDFFKGRVALMPEPDRWRESLANATRMYNEDYVSTETFLKIKCPVLVMGGDRDEYTPVEAMIKSARALKDAGVSIIPGCSHVVFFCNFPAVWEALHPFIEKDTIK
jgi:pimeloyl-ACP methyl ester carboxylesterase